MEKKQLKEKKGIDCCHIAIALCLVIIICFAMFFNYSAKLSKDRIEITKLTHRAEEEQKEIDFLKKELQELRKKLESRN